MSKFIAYMFNEAVLYILTDGRLNDPTYYNAVN